MFTKTFRKQSETELDHLIREGVERIGPSDRGDTLKEAERIARIVLEFHRYKRAGLARLLVQADDHPDVSWMDKKQRADWDGTAYGTVVECRAVDSLDDSEGWEHVDSCWGHIGYDDPANPWENPYVVDEMAAAIDWHKSRGTVLQ